MAYQVFLSLAATLVFVIVCICIFILAAKPIRYAADVYKQMICEHEWDEEIITRIFANHGKNGELPFARKYSVKCKNCHYVKSYRRA